MICRLRRSQNGHVAKKYGTTMSRDDRQPDLEHVTIERFRLVMGLASHDYQISQRDFIASRIFTNISSIARKYNDQGYVSK